MAGVGSGTGDWVKRCCGLDRSATRLNLTLHSGSGNCSGTQLELASSAFFRFMRLLSMDIELGTKHDELSSSYLEESLR